MFVFPSFLFLVSQYFNPVSLLIVRIREFIGAHFFVRIGLLLAFGSFLSSSLMAAEPRIEAGALDPVKTVYKSEPFFDTEMIIRMIANLDARPNGKKLNIAVGSFNYENTDLQSSFSSVLAKEMEVGLAASGKVNLISRKRLAEDHAKDGGNPYKSLEPNSKIQKESMPGVNAILRGRFYRSGDGVMVEAELAQVGDGETKLAHLDISAEKVRERLSVNQTKFG
jgi:TolB-like protein